MNLKQLKATQRKLVDFVEEFKDYLGRSERLHWCQLYLSGLLLNGERKSIQPMAERIPGGNEQAMQQFVNQSPWAHEPIQHQLSHFLAKKLKVEKGVLVLDDTSLPKKGKSSVGVSHQYCGALGKVANCQSIVTWHYTQQRGEHFPIVGELFLPESWINNPEQLLRCGVPESRFTFKKKWELAYELLGTISQKTLPYEAIVFDAGYGEIREFLGHLDKRGDIFVAQIPGTHSFWPLDIRVTTRRAKRGRPRQYEAIADKAYKPLSAVKWRIKLEQEGIKWQKVKLSLASKKYTKIMAIRVREVITQAFYRPGKERWLLIEKFSDGTYKYFVSNATPNTPVKKIINWAHERWKIEQSYQQLKEELGLDHFEGRSWRGLHHHITLCFMAYAFLLLLKKQRFKKNCRAYFA